MAQVFDLLYGTTLRGKSQAIKQLLEKLTKQTGKKARVYLGDGSAVTYESMKEAGLVDVVEFDILDWPFTVMDRMVRGWMPDSTGKWRAVKNEDYIATVYEGAAVAGKFLLGPNKGGLAWRASKGELIGNKKEEEVVKTLDESVPWLAGSGQEGGVAVGSNTMGHYRHMQPQLLANIKHSKSLPGWVLWTSHPVETADKDEGGKAGDYGKLQGKTIVGPDMGGKAMASWVSREFGNTLHFDISTKKVDEKDEHQNAQRKAFDREFRIYTRDHFDPDGNWFTEYRAGNRCAIPSMMPDYFVDEKDDPAGYALVRFYEIMAQAQKKDLERMKGVAA